MKQKTILLAPLNWGLGHATRCVPLILAAQTQGFRVILASDGAAAVFLRHEFPDLDCVELPSYHIRYPFDNILANILYLLPNILWAVFYENIACQQIVKNREIDVLISDNRYGMFYWGRRKVKNVFLGHQLNIKLNAQNEHLNLIEKAVAGLQRLFLTTFFDTIAVPDAADDSENLAGVLCHSAAWKTGVPLVYIGIQSRFLSYKRQKAAAVAAENTPKKRVLILLSGPEPQRTRLEDLLLRQAENLPDYLFTLVRGLPQEAVVTTAFAENITQVSHLFTPDLADLFDGNDLIICRSGYSTLMDLAFFKQKKLILIPTPGQTEQLYLAHRLAQKNRCIVQQQSSINLAKALNDTETIDFFTLSHTENCLDALFQLLSF